MTAQGRQNLEEIPIGRLKIEHLLMERFIALMKKEMASIDQGKKPDLVLIESTIDFFHTYAHRCHYGKEEEMLFQKLYGKRLLPEHKKIIDELVLEHIQEKRYMDGLEIAKEDYWRGRTEAVAEIHGYMKSVVGFYPGHMAKEEKEFFLPAMEYFDRNEQAAMLLEFDEFDRSLIHEKYIRVADRFER